jgi:hypothetical protein
MAAVPVNLDQGPPLPPNLQPAPQATTAGLAGPQQAQQSGSASLADKVSKIAMGIEQAMQDIVDMLPSAAGLEGIRDQFRKVVGTALAKGAVPPEAQGPPAGGMMMSPFGGQQQ